MYFFIIMKRHFFLFSALSALTVLAACSEKASLTINTQSSSESGDLIGVQKMQMLMPTGKQLIDPVHGKEEGLAYGAITGEDGILANGVATAHYFEDKSTIIGVQVNIADAKEGTYYDAWLESPGGQQPIDLGQFENSPGDVRHSLHFESKDNLQTYTRIVISLQQTGGGSVPGQTVASTTLQATSR